MNQNNQNGKLNAGMACVFVLMLSCLIAAARPAARPVAAAADTVFVHGTVITMDAKDSVTNAIAVRGGVIEQLGTDASVLRLVGPRTHVIDLRGHTISPGLIDSHGHFADGGLDELYHLDLSGVRSIAEVKKLIAERVRTLKPGEWVEGDGWDEGKLEEQRYIYAADLDQAAPGNPVWLTHTTGHYGVANSLALSLAAVTADTPNPPAGTIDRLLNGQVSGVLKEAAMAAVTKLIPEPTMAQRKLAILHVLGELHSEGVTSVKDADIFPPTWEAYRELLEEGQLSERVCVLWHAGTTMETARAALARIESLPRVPASLGDGHLLSCGAKLYMDGSGGARTAWMNEDWNKNYRQVDTGNRGYPATDPAVYKQEVRLFHQAGVNIGTHAIGDRAIDYVADTYAEVLQEKPTPGLRHSIIHANIPTEHAIGVMADLQHRFDAGYPESQAPFMWWIGDTYAANFGPDRSMRLEPLRTYLDRRIMWTGGSDYFVTPLAARYGLWASVARETVKGAHPFGTVQSVDIHAALRSYTNWAARQLFLETRTGSLEPGKAADIAVWAKNPYSIPTAELKDLQCVMTLVDGKIVFDRTKVDQAGSTGK